MTRIIIINPYFGTFPVWFSAFLKSCGANPTIDWLIPTDCQYAGRIPDNVRLAKMSMPELKEKIERRLGYKVSLGSPIKVCDFRPAFGVIFEEEIRSYGFWGHCDFDLIFGNLRNFLTEERLARFGKLLMCGHLSLYRNDRFFNHLFTLDAPGFAHREIFESPDHRFFEEYGGLHQIARHHKVDALEGFDLFVNINSANFRLTQMQGRNYARQAYLWDEGRIFRFFEDLGEIRKEEYAYLHFQKRKMRDPGSQIDTARRFWIEPDGFDFSGTETITREALKEHNRGDFSYDLSWRLKNFKSTRAGQKILKLTPWR